MSLSQTVSKSPGESGAWVNPRFQQRIPELDGLRGLAILFVVVWHYIACLITPAPDSLAYQLMRPLQIAWSGVDLFFVLSGFLIGGILLDAKTSDRFFSTFYMRRFHRIFPLYYAWLAIFYVMLALPVHTEFFERMFNAELPPWCYPLYLQNIFMSVQQQFGAEWLGITWSLAIEEQFYLLLPLAVRFLPLRTLVILVVTAIAGAPIIRMVLYFGGNEYFGPYTLLPCRADSLGFGVLCAVLLRNRTAWNWLIEHRRYIVYASGMLFCGVVFLWWHSQGRIMSSIGYTWMAMFYSTWLLLGMVEPGQIVRGILNSLPLQQLGALAYGVYMFHQGVNALLHAAFFHASPVVNNVPTLLVTVSAAILTFLLAKLSWKYFEKPIVKRGQTQYAY